MKRKKNCCARFHERARQNNGRKNNCKRIAYVRIHTHTTTRSLAKGKKEDEEKKCNNRSSNGIAWYGMAYHGSNISNLMNNINGRRVVRGMFAYIYTTFYNNRKTQ